MLREEDLFPNMVGVDRDAFDALPFHARLLVRAHPVRRSIDRVYALIDSGMLNSVPDIDDASNIILGRW